MPRCFALLSMTSVFCVIAIIQQRAVVSKRKAPETARIITLAGLPDFRFPATMSPSNCSACPAWTAEPRPKAAWFGWVLAGQAAE